MSVLGNFHIFKSRQDLGVELAWILTLSIFGICMLLRLSPLCCLQPSMVASFSICILHLMCKELLQLPSV